MPTVIESGDLNGRCKGISLIWTSCTPRQSDWAAGRRGGDARDTPYDAEGLTRRGEIARCGGWAMLTSRADAVYDDRLTCCPLSITALDERSNT